MKRIFFLFFYLFFWLFPLEVKAEVSVEQEVQQMKDQFMSMQKRLSELEGKVIKQQEEINAHASQKQAYEERIQVLEKQLTGPSVTAAGDSQPQRRILGKWNPEIGVVADTVFRIDSPKVDEEGADRVSVRELELILGSHVDPYSRLDATIAFSDFETPSLEEAYLTHFGLPAQVTARLGKFKPKVGKAIPVHRDSLETVDEPLVIQRYFGVEGYNKSGVDFSKMLNLPWPVTHQLSFGILEGGNGEEGTAFGETRRRPTLYSHLKNYLDVTDTTGIELGLSHMIGSRDADSHFEIQVFGVDGTFTQHLNVNQNFKLQGELFSLDRKETADFDGNIWGAYAQADFKFHQQWSAGFRYDYVQPVDNDRSLNPEKADVGYK